MVVDGKNAFIEEQGIQEAVERATADEEQLVGGIYDISQKISAATEDGPEFDGRADALAALADPDQFMVSCLTIILREKIDAVGLRVRRYLRYERQAEIQFEKNGKCFAIAADFIDGVCYPWIATVFGLGRLSIEGAMLPIHGCRYIYVGGFFGTVEGRDQLLTISIPTPFIYPSSSRESLDGLDHTTFLFAQHGVEIILVAYGSDDDSDDGPWFFSRACLSVLRGYTYDQFTSEGGFIVDESGNIVTAPFDELGIVLGSDGVASIDAEGYSVINV